MSTFYELYVQAVDAYAGSLEKQSTPLSEDTLRLVSDAYVVAHKHGMPFHHTSCTCSSIDDVVKLFRRAFEAQPGHDAAKFMQSDGFYILETHLWPLVPERERLLRSDDVIGAALPVIHAHLARQAFETKYPASYRFIQADDACVQQRVRHTSPRKPPRKKAVKREAASGAASALGPASARGSDPGSS